MNSCVYRYLTLLSLGLLSSMIKSEIQMTTPRTGLLGELKQAVLMIFTCIRIRGIIELKEIILTFFTELHNPHHIFEGAYVFSNFLPH